ncbi:MAG: hypothetical protein LBF43_04340 [Puniceicoccales bacterium]|nr:hypothetical protein [Puniceicoccales bacterium]
MKTACSKYLDAALTVYPGLFTTGPQSEQEALQTEIVQRTVALIEDINKTANPKITVAQAANLIKENLDKILYQQFRDQSMITGSDHGIHHIVMGNIKNSLAVLDECPEVTSEEKLMVLQTMVDHDLGYTTYAAQADFGAAKDHPLASRAYVDQNMNSIFKSSSFQDPHIPGGAEAFIKDSILSHSYATNLNESLDFGNPAKHVQSLRNVVAVVDAMGTTQDTKLPSVFRQRQIQDQLFEVGIYQVLANIAKDQKAALEKAHPNLAQRSNAVTEEINRLGREATKHANAANAAITTCKQAMLQAIDNTPDASMPPDLKARYRQAITVDFNAFGARGIVPQFAGSLLSAQAASQGAEGSGPYKMAITMEVSLPEKLAQSIAGQADIAIQDRLNAFNKMAQDIAPGQDLGAQIDQRLYGNGDVTRAESSMQVSTPLINFTFNRSELDAQMASMLSEWFAQDAG